MANLSIRVNVFTLAIRFLVGLLADLGIAFSTRRPMNCVFDKNCQKFLGMKLRVDDRTTPFIDIVRSEGPAVLLGSYLQGIYECDQVGAVNGSELSTSLPLFA
jgi:hypothetical protein